MFVNISSTACVAALLAVAGLAAPVTTAHAQSAGERNYIRLNDSAIGETRRISVGLNKSMVIDLPGDAHDILVANPEVADAITRTSRRIYIFAKQVGETNIFIFDAAGKQLLSIDLVIERDIAGLEANLAKYIPGSEIRVEMVNDNVILTGTVPTPQASARAVELARVFVTGGEATTNQFDTPASGTGDTIYLGDQEPRQVSQIVNLLQIDGEDQVNLKVTIAEIQRTVVKQLGIDLTAVGSAGALTYALVGDNPFPLGKSTSHSAGSLGYSHNGNSIDAVIRALDQSGVMRTLAEPSLTAISGETARFRVGGEYQVSDGKEESDDGTVTYNYRQVEYGVGLAFTPVVLSPGRISLKIRTEVSEPTTEGSYAIPRGKQGAATAPGIRRRLAETTVELPSGGTMVLAGLLKDDVRQTVSGFPGLSKIPVIGTLFRSREFQRFETELVILVTPYLVRPVARSAMARPDDNFNAPNDGAGIFLGRVNRIYGVVEGNLPPGRYNGQVGFIYK